MSLPRSLADLKKSGPGFLQRQGKHLRQLRYGWGHPRRLSFVFGCQRSGTKMVMRVLDRCPVTHIYHENHDSAFRDFQLRSDNTLRMLLRLSPAPAQIFKPICDSQDADRLLERFPEARGLWIYRHPDDVTRSATEKWGEHQRDVVTAVVRSDTSPSWGWRTARVPAAVAEALRAVWRPDLSPEEGGLLFWYLRNAFYFALGLDRHPRMRLACYEDLVQEPARAFPPVFAHLGAPFTPAYIDRVRADSVRRGAPPPASPEIRALVEGLHQRLGEAVRAQALPPPPSPVLMLINTLGVGGAERYVVTVANWLVEQGTTVVVASSGGDLVSALDPRVSHRTCALRKVRADLPLAVAEVRALVEELAPAAIVANSLITTWIGRLASAERRVAVVNIAHGWPAERYARVGPLLRVADQVVAVSPDVRDKLVAAGLPAERCTVIQNGVDLRPLGRRTGPLRAAARAALGGSGQAGEVLAVAVGRLEAQKAHQHIISIASTLRDQAPGLRFAIVGTGTRQAELEGLIEAAGLQDRVRLTGLRADVADLLGAADLFINCSDWEGMPLTTIEAMASGLPVVATRTEGAAELIDEEVGLLAAPGDTAALAAATLRLAEDAPARARLGAAAQDRARARFSHERMARELAEMLSAAVIGAPRIP